MNSLGSVDQVMLLELSRQVLYAAIQLSIPEGQLWSHFRNSKLGGARIFRQLGCVFVTLRRNCQLRGCIGKLGKPEPLGQTIAKNCFAAALRDPRFDPVEPSELAEIQIELTLVGSLQRMESPDRLIIGRHGILISQGDSRGLLLPQVAEELGLGPSQFLALCCRKAGLQENAWKREARVEHFSAQHFGFRSQ